MPKWHWLMPTQDLWGRGSEILNFRTGSKNLSFMQVRKETLRVAPLEACLGDFRAGGLGVPMMLDLCFNFPARTRKYSLGNLY